MKESVKIQFIINKSGSFELIDYEFIELDKNILWYNELYDVYKEIGENDVKNIVYVEDITTYLEDIKNRNTDNVDIFLLNTIKSINRSNRIKKLLK